MPITINGSGTITGVSVGGLPDGIVDTDMLAAQAATAAKRGPGSVLQVVHEKIGQTSSISTAGTTFLDTQCEAQITPIGTNSLILVIAVNQAQNNTGNGGVTFRLMRDTSAIGTFTSTGYLAHFNSSGNHLGTDTMIDVDDAANLSGTLTYKMQYAVSSGGTAFTRANTMTLVEVAR